MLGAKAVERAILCLMERYGEIECDVLCCVLGNFMYFGRCRP